MEEYRIRVRIFIGVVLVAIGILGFRLAQLQILDQEQFAEESQDNAVKERRVIPARGAILDRHGELIVSNQPSYSILLTPRYFDESKASLLAELMEMPDSVVAAKIEEAKDWSPFQASPIFKEVPFDIFSRVQENDYRLPGITYNIIEKRSYLSDARAAHALGYIREINGDQLARYQEQAQENDDASMYRQGDLIGQTGVEREYEPFLRGEPGSAFKLVNVHGREISAYKSGTLDRAPTSGYNMHLAMDLKVQALAESLFVNKRGGAVAIDPETGGIIALVSEPDFDPTIFSGNLDQTTWEYLNGYQKPLLNRATMNLMPPGSTWKPFMALMSLAEGNIKPGETVYCGGGHPLGGGRFFTCMGVHGPMSVVTGIQNSCNTFFFEMMYRTDVNTFNRYARMFGFGERAPTDIREQTEGLIPDSAYFNRFAGEGVWGPGWTLSLGIGQGNMGVTPLQMARYIAAVGNKGTLVTPHLVDKLVNPETGDVIYPDLPPPAKIDIKEEYFDLVKEGTKRVMELGTGRLAQIPDITSGGKTGTAQAPGQGRIDHSVFVMFAPWDEPKIAIAVQCENSGFGGNCAAPIASLMAEMYLKGEIPDTPQKQVRMQRALTARSQPLPKPALNEEKG